MKKTTANPYAVPKANLVRFDDFYARDAILRGQWTDKHTAEGKERACLLAALSEEVFDNERAAACPANLMPEWLAHLTPSMDDNVSAEYWPEMVREYRAAAAVWNTLDEKAWRRVLARTMCASLRAAETYDKSGSCLATSGLWLRVLDGDEPTAAAWSAAASAAWSAEDSAVRSAASAAWSAARSAAESEVWSAAWSVVWDGVTKATLAAILEEAAAAIPAPKDRVSL